VVADRGDGGKLDGGADPHRDLAGVLHDVSNALTVLLGWVSESRSPDASPEDVAYALKIIDQRARIARDLARQAIGAPQVDEQRPIGELADEVAETLRVEASHAGVTLVVRGRDVGARVSGALDLSQVLTNLALNAIAYAPKGSSVNVEVTIDEERAWVVVSDEGPGVPASRRDGIFRGDSLRPGGTGVGLRHSRALARARGGDVELLAPEPTGGARFRLCWPRVDGPMRRPSTLPRARELSGRRLLLIEDDQAVIQLLETALESRGASVTVASSGADLAQALVTAPYDVALLDLSPIEDDVGGAIAKLRASSPGIDLVLITGSADRVPEAAAAEPMKLVRKPFELGEVLAALKR
jgi:CheY-like chemotaxis protein/anti-sigma regulatory factor (Ser/Thr protein kinase)